MEATLSFSTHLPFLLLDQAHAIIIAQTARSSNDCDETCWWVLPNKTQWCVDKWKSSIQTGELIIGKMSLAERSQVGLFIARPITDTNHERLSSLIPAKPSGGLLDPSATEKQQLMFYDGLPKHICSSRWNDYAPELIITCGGAIKHLCAITAQHVEREPAWPLIKLQWFFPLRLRHEYDIGESNFNGKSFTRIGKRQISVHNTQWICRL